MSELYNGFADSEITEEVKSWYVDKIGGYPVILDNSSKSFTSKCEKCNEYRCLVAQMYCEVDENERCLYVMCCLNKKCFQSDSGWKVYRIQKRASQKVDSPQVTQKAPDEFEVDSWGDDDWGDSNEDNNEEEEQQVEDVLSNVQDKLSELNIKDIETPYNFQLCDKPQHCVNTFAPFYMSFYEGHEDFASKATKYEKQLAAEHEQSELAKTNSVNDGYEKCPWKVEKNLKKFQMAVRSCPKQVVRYCLGGEALVLSNNDLKNFNVPKCSSCNKNCQFELQLMPALISHLKYKSAEVEYGTLLIYTCKENCWKNKNSSNFEIHEEKCILIKDSDSNLFK